MSELVMEQMDLYRYTKESILAGRGAAAFRDMNLKARDRALQQEMKAERNLHPALCTPDGHYKARNAALWASAWAAHAVSYDFINQLSG